MQKGELLFILGGARSGKSTYAEKLAEKISKDYNKAVIYIATFPACDDPEMIERIKRHKDCRTSEWKTLELETIDEIIQTINENKLKNSVIIIECLTILVSNAMVSKPGDEILNKIKLLIEFIKNSENIYIIVSNEVGQGIVPENKLARDYRDILGFANQEFAKNANEVYVIFAGIPVKIKEL